MAVAVPMRMSLTGQRAFTEEVAGPEHRHDRLLADTGEHRELDRAFLQIPDVVRGVALREYDPAGGVFQDSASRGFEVDLDVELANVLRCDCPRFCWHEPI